jgi:hypothetical protein
MTGHKRGKGILIAGGDEALEQVGVRRRGAGWTRSKAAEAVEDVDELSARHDPALSGGMGFHL